MKVAVSVQGRFHAFYLAHQLAQRGLLGQLITTYPKSEVVRYGVPGRELVCYPLLEILGRILRRAAAATGYLWNPQFDLAERFDLCAAQALRPGQNLFVGWSSSALRSLRRAKRLGMVAIVERGSSHMLFQQEILREEYARHGLQANQTHPRIIEKELLEYDEADYIAIPSTYVRRTFVAQGVPEHKLMQVPYGVDLRAFYPEAREDRKFRVMYCGALTLQKGVHYLLQAFNELALPDAELWLVGQPTSEVTPFLKRCDRSRVVVHGHKPQSRLRWYYSQASVFCLPSIQEGLAMVLVQAMACGLPVVCTTNTGGEDLIHNTEEGFVVPIRSIESLKEKLMWLYEHPQECRAMGDCARRRAAEGFTWDDYGRRITQAYEQVLRNRPVNPVLCASAKEQG